MLYTFFSHHMLAVAFVDLPTNHLAFLLQFTLWFTFTPGRGNFFSQVSYACLIPDSSLLCFYSPKA